jgi:hypothetical protein
MEYRRWSALSEGVISEGILGEIYDISSVS